MRALGAELVEHGQDFNAAYDYAKDLAAERGLHLFPSYHPILAGTEVWVKHENHTPIGAFKLRGGVWFRPNSSERVSIALLRTVMC